MIYSTIGFPVVVSKTNKQVYFIYFLRALHFYLSLGLLVLVFFIGEENTVPFFIVAIFLFGMIGFLLPETVKIEGKLRISSEAIVYVSNEKEIVYEMEHVKDLTMMYDGYEGQNRSISNFSFCSGNNNVLGFFYKGSSYTYNIKIERKVMAFMKRFLRECEQNQKPIKIVDNRGKETKIN